MRLSFVYGYLCEILQCFLTRMGSSFVTSLFGVTLLLAVCLGVVATRVVATAKPAVVVLCRSEKPIKSFSSFYLVLHNLDQKTFD